MTAPFLKYDILPAPMPIEVSKGVTFQLLGSYPNDGYVTISAIQLRLPLEGSLASDLSASLGNVPMSSNLPGWSFTQNGSKLTLRPNDPASGTVPPKGAEDPGLVFTIGPIAVNDTPGTFVMEVLEQAEGQTSDPVSFTFSKWPAAFEFCDFVATHPSVQPGSTAELSWTVEGASELTLQYNGNTIKNPTSPFTSQGLNSTTVFTLTATSSYNGENVQAVLQTAVEVETPVIVSNSSEFDIVYAGQGNALHWKTQQADYCVLKANGVQLDAQAPSASPPQGYPIAASIMKSTTTFELAPVGNGHTGPRANWPAFAKSFQLKSTFKANPGWGYVTVDQQGQTAYICNSHTNALDIVSMSTGAVQHSVPVGLGPRGVSLSADGTTAYVSAAFDNSVAIVDLATFAVTGQLTVPSPAGSAVLGGTLCVASMDSASPAIVLVDLETKATTSTIAVQGVPADVTINPDGQMLYVANSAATTVDIYAVSGGAKTGSVDVGCAPTSMACSSNGASVYSGTRLGTAISVINSHIPTPDLTASVPASMSPAAIGVSASGQFLAAIGPTGFFVFELGLPAATAKLVSTGIEVQSA